MELKKLGNAFMWIGIGGFITTLLMEGDREWLWLSIMWIGIAIKWLSND